MLRTYRLNQARVNLELMLNRQMELRRKETQALHKYGEYQFA
jgi:hypothetical protein